MLDGSYWTNPSSAGYSIPSYDATCQICGRVYTFSQQQLDTKAEIVCPYCGAKQNLWQAHQRYSYDYNQQQQQLQQQQQQQQQEKQPQQQQSKPKNCWTDCQPNGRNGAVTCYTRCN